MKKVGIFLSIQLLISISVSGLKSLLISVNHLVVRQLPVLIIHALLICMETISSFLITPFVSCRGFQIMHVKCHSDNHNYKFLALHNLTSQGMKHIA